VRCILAWCTGAVYPTLCWVPCIARLCFHGETCALPKGPFKVRSHTRSNVSGAVRPMCHIGSRCRPMLMCWVTALSQVRDITDRPHEVLCVLLSRACYVTASLPTHSCAEDLASPKAACDTCAPPDSQKNPLGQRCPVLANRWCGVSMLHAMPSGPCVMHLDYCQ
jgi:hypothetical protein